MNTDGKDSTKSVDWVARANIKWRRSGNVRPVSTAAAKVEKMKNQLIGEAYEDWEPGQLLRVLEAREAMWTIDSEFNDHCVSPELEAGDVLMYLGWVAGESWEYVPNEPVLVSGPKWLIGDRVYLFVLDPEELVPVYQGEEEEER